jgi:hypothetical protein
MATPVPPRVRGWLRFLWDKATTEDDWSAAGTPHPWWDQTSTAPMCSFPRFDLAETAYILPVLADRTPAWREVYTRIADELVGRHTSFWAAIDWLTLIGQDPNRHRYPPEWLAYLPPHLQGRYDPPGWTANGVEPWGLQPDPIGSDGNLFFRGWFNLLLSIYRYVAGDEKWEAPFRVAGYREQTFEWTHYRIAEFLNAQWKDRPQGPHCENTKIWPVCVSSAGLALKLYDQVAGSEFHGVYDEWVEFAKRHYLRLDGRGGLASFPLYYDPLEEVLCHFPGQATGLAALLVTPYVLPQHPEFGEFLYREGARLVGWSDPRKPVLMTPDPRLLVIGHLVAREVGDDVTEKRLRERIDEICEPRTFGEDDDRFGYWFGTGENWPRGQLASLLLLSEAGEPGAWRRVFNNPEYARRFREPTVEGVDYPTLGISEAWNDTDRGELHVSTYAATPSRRGEETTIRVTSLPNADVSVFFEGAPYPRWRPLEDREIEIELPVGEWELRIATRGERRPDRTPGRVVGEGVGAATAGGGDTVAPRSYQPTAAKCTAGCC